MDYLAVVTAVATVGASIAGAISAWMSQRSAKATRDTVEEARLARQNEILPRFIIERNFVGLDFRWQHPNYPDDRPSFLARQHYHDEIPVPITFSLSNYGQSPSYEVQVTFEIIDHNGDVAVPSAFASFGLTDGSQLAPITHGETPPRLGFMGPSGSGGAFGMGRRVTVSVPNSVPGIVRSIELPQSIACRLFVRGLQAGAAGPMGGPGFKVVLTARVAGYTVEGERVANLFRYDILMQGSRPAIPVYVYGYVEDRAMKPVDSELTANLF